MSNHDEPFPWTDAAGTEWLVYDFSVRELPGGGYQRPRYPIGSDRAEYRAFKSGDRVLCFRFGSTSDRDARPSVLERQLAEAKDIREAGAGVARRPLPNSAPGA